MQKQQRDIAKDVICQLSVARLNRDNNQSACKPGSVWSCLRDGHSSGTPLAQRLVQPTRVAGQETNLASSGEPIMPGHPYLVLLPVGFTLPRLLPGARCALTAPFHPCSRRLRTESGLLSVALSLGLPPAAVSRHRASLEPGLSSSPALPLRAAGPAAVRPTGAHQ